MGPTADPKGIPGNRVHSRSSQRSRKESRAKKIRRLVGAILGYAERLRAL
jgi:hypothetical protein